MQIDESKCYKKQLFLWLFENIFECHWFVRCYGRFDFWSWHFRYFFGYLIESASRNRNCGYAQMAVSTFNNNHHRGQRSSSLPNNYHHHNYYHHHHHHLRNNQVPSEAQSILSNSNTLDGKRCEPISVRSKVLSVWLSVSLNIFLSISFPLSL